MGGRGWFGKSEKKRRRKGRKGKERTETYTHCGVRTKEVVLRRRIGRREWVVWDRTARQRGGGKKEETMTESRTVEQREQKKKMMMMMTRTGKEESRTAEDMSGR